MAMKYCMVTAHSHKSLFKETPLRSGLYQWIDIFGGCTENYQDLDFEDFDVVHFNWCISDTPIFQELVKRTENTSTILVLNTDHSVDTYFRNTQIPIQILSTWLKGADCYFATEDYGQSLLSFIVDKPVKCMPHPVDTEMLHRFRTSEREERVGVIYHWYEHSIELPYLILDKLNLKKILLGWIKEGDPKTPQTKTMYPLRHEDQQYATFIEKMNQCKYIIDLYTLRSWGRATAESAALGIPTVGSNLVDSCRRCFPNTISDPWDIQSAYKNLKKLIDNKITYDKIANFAFEQSDYYSRELCEQRFLEMIEECKK